MKTVKYFITTSVVESTHHFQVLQSDVSFASDGQLYFLDRLPKILSFLNVQREGNWYIHLLSGRTNSYSFR